MEIQESEFQLLLQQILKVNEYWGQLPAEYQAALETILLHFDRHIPKVPAGRKQSLLNLTLNYARTLSKHFHLNQQKSLEALKHRQDRLKLLDQIHQLDGVEKNVLFRLADELTLVNVPAGEEVLVQGRDSDGVYFIQDGNLQVFVNKQLMTHLSPGRTFGELSSLKGEKIASATVKALTDCCLFKINHSQFLQIVNESPRLWQNMFREMTSRFTTGSQRLSEVLQHNPQGLIKVDQEGRVTNEYSTQCVRFFKQPHLTGSPFHELVFPFHEKAQEDWLDVFPLFFEDIPMDFKQLADILPRQTTLMDQHDVPRYYRLSYYACVNSEGLTTAIDVGMEDITETMELSQSNQRLETERAVQMRLYDNPDLFLNFLQLSKTVLDQLREFYERLTQHEKPQTPERDALLRSLHSLKGSSGMFLLEDMMEATHRLEDHFKELKLNQEVAQDWLERLAEEIGHIQQNYDEAQALIDNISEELKRRLTGMVISRKEFDRVKMAIKRGSREIAKTILRNVEKIPARKLVQQWEAAIDRFGRKLGKSAQLNIEGGDLTIPKFLFEKLEPPLLHIVRNAVDHGLETPQERLAYDKDEQGIIHVSFRMEVQNLCIELTDDGRGIDFDKIVQKARDNRELDQNQIKDAIQAQEPWRILLMPGFTTAAEVSELSGRGVGLDAVNEAIKSLKGSLKIYSVPMGGTTFFIEIPLED